MEKIVGIVMSDGTILDATALKYITLTEKGNVEVTSDKNINVEPFKSLKIKAGAGGQIEFLADHTGDLTEVLVKALVSIDETGADLAAEVPVRFKLNSSELELNTKGAADVNPYDIKFKTGLKSDKSGEHYCQAKLKARSIDLRCYEHGGIALQPCGTDNSHHENKIKFESSRTSGLNEAAAYSDEGGKGIEFGTFNTEHSSLFTKDYRFNKEGKVYAVTRGAVTETESGKFDYPTQADDFKDILDEEMSCTWEDIVKAVKYLKSEGHIS